MMFMIPIHDEQRIEAMPASRKVSRR